MGYLDRIRVFNNGDTRNYLPLHGMGRRFGWVSPARAALLKPYPQVFRVADDRVDLDPALTDYDTASAALDPVLRDLAARGHLPHWREERYAVAAEFGETPILSVERAACPFLGIRSWGFHLNGFVRRRDGLYLWIAERSHTKPTYPGQLDNTVAGGHPEGLTLAQNVVKECEEEASIPNDLAARSVPVGMMSYCHESDDGLKPDQIFIYDLELPDDFVPIPADGEVESFTLMPAEEVMAIVRDTDRFKYNCAPVLIHFFIRYGLLDPDRDPDYGRICLSLQTPPSP